MHPGKALRAEASRTPVIEAYFRSEMFIANDVALDNGAGDAKNDLVSRAAPEASMPSGHLAIITGPNMAGKSTYIRQIGIMQIMAQAGSFVAAKAAELPVVDRVFLHVSVRMTGCRAARVRSLSKWPSARVFSVTTRKIRLILLDEVGRGTSTYDGISIAQAMIASLNAEERGRPKTLFATHYSELAHLISQKNGIIGLTVSVNEKDGHVVFVRKIVEGVADKSYGIHVAQMAGMPKSVTERATQICRKISKKNRA